MKCLIYCTKGEKNNHLHELYKEQKYPYYQIDNVKGWDVEPIPLNGKVVARFWCDKIEEIKFIKGEEYSDMIINSRYETFCLSRSNLYSKSCLYFEQLHNYLKGKNGYAIHIKHLEVFDRPLELNEICSYYAETEKNIYYKVLLKAPQNMCYAYYNGELYCLISIQPQWVAKILNGEKTIEVRKKVLKEMLER